MLRNDLAPTCRALRAVTLFAATLGACSDLYYDRREGVTLHAGDAIASNIAAQTVDPWPRAAANRRINGNGERTQKAVERYRTNKVTPPQGMDTSSVQFAPSSTAPAAAASTPSP